MDQVKKCPRCENEYPLNEDYFYPARKIDRKKVSWQSYCRNCWKDINKANKERRKEEMTITIHTYFTGFGAGL